MSQTGRIFKLRHICHNPDKGYWYGEHIGFDPFSMNELDLIFHLHYIRSKIENEQTSLINIVLLGKWNDATNDERYNA